MTTTKSTGAQQTVQATDLQAASKSARFLDSNIFIRHLTNDHPVHSPACFALIQAVEQGRVQAWTSDIVVAEVIFVLSSKVLYNVGRATIRDLLLPIINLPGIKLPNKRMYERVFELYTSLNIDYADAYNAALMESRKQPELYSYDTDFDRIVGLRRLEP
jgi:predicted nucleic acid-binding protein